MLGGVVLLTLLCAFPPQSGDAALLFQTIEYSAIVGMVLAVPCADLASARVDGRQVLLKNEAVFGIPRWQMYLSRLFTALLLGVGLVAVMSLFALLLAGIFLPGIDQLPQILSQYALLTLTALPLWMASAGLFLCLKFIFAPGPLRGFWWRSTIWLDSPLRGRRPRWSPPIRESLGPSAPCSMPSTP